MCNKFLTSSNDIFRSDYPCSVTVAGIVYPNVEAAFQAAKTEDEALKKEIAAAPSARRARQIGRSLSLVADWDNKRSQVMLFLLRQKFMADWPFNALVLVGSGTDPIVADMNNDYWGCGADGSGQNMLGKLLEQLRTEMNFLFGPTPSPVVLDADEEDDEPEDEEDDAPVDEDLPIRKVKVVGLAGISGAVLDATTDTRTVWVNVNGMCVARFSPTAAEVLTDASLAAAVTPEIIKPPDWDQWVGRIMHHFGADVPSNFKPAWTKWAK
jgi:N-glycosidase YbiA